MKEFDGKVAFITGGASGIGYGIAQAFVAEGMKVMLADIEEAALTNAVEALRGQGADVHGVLCDVAREEAIKEAAAKTIDAFGKIHVVVNNAGVGGGNGETGAIGTRDWRWTVDVNLMGVVYGCETFVPLIKSHGEGGHVINTASMAGHIGVSGMAPYNATKFAVVGMSESLHQELQSQNIGVSVLCPGWVATNIHRSRRNHPDAEKIQDEIEAGFQTDSYKVMENIIENGMSPEVVGKWVVESMKKDALYIFTHPSMRAGIDARFAAISAAYDACEESALIKGDDASRSDTTGGGENVSQAILGLN